MRYIFSIIADFFYALSNKLKHRSSAIHLRAYLRNSHLEGNNSLFIHSKVTDSSIGKHTIITEHTSIVASTIGAHNKIFDHSSLFNVSTGSYTYISSDCRILNTSIGNFCSVGPRTIIAGGKHPKDFISSSPVFYSTARQCGTTFATVNSFKETEHVTIGHDVWIGAHCYIADGVTIETGAIIGTGAVVTKNVKAYTIVGGIPAKVIGTRFDEPTAILLLKLEWWNWDKEKISKHASLFNAPLSADKIKALEMLL